jgi:hypothetical protein
MTPECRTQAAGRTPLHSSQCSHTREDHIAALAQVYDSGQWVMQRMVTVVIGQPGPSARASPRDGPEGPRSQARSPGFGDSTPPSIWHSKWHSPPTRRQIGTPPTGLPQLRAALVCCHHGEFDKGGGVACLWGALVGALAVASAGARGPTLEAGPLGLGTLLGPPLPGPSSQGRRASDSTRSVEPLQPHHYPSLLSLLYPLVSPSCYLPT